MKFIRIAPLGMREGQPHYRVRLVCKDGTQHRLKVSHADLASALAFNRAARSKLGKEVVSISTSRSDWEQAVHRALVRPQAAQFEDTSAGQAAVRQLASRAYGRLAEFLNSGSGDRDELEDILSEAMDNLTSEAE